MYAFSRQQFTELAIRPLELAVVIPTFNEGQNIEPLLERLALVLNGIEHELIFVDDGSTDETVPLLTAHSLCDSRIRLIRRFGRRGLASAVVEGMLASAAPVLAVIDADLQHDESILPQLYEAVARQGADMAIGTRYAAGGSTGDWQTSRLRISRFATSLAQSVLRVRLSDPMSGFFAISRKAFMASQPHLSSFGYKIMLDMIASAPEPLRLREIPYCFRPRVAGDSKLDCAIGFEYGLLLVDKTVGRFLPVRFLMFLGVGALGLLVNLVALALFMHVAALPFWVAQSLAICCAMTFNFALNNIFTYRDRRRRGWGFLAGLLGFYTACALGGIANVGIGSLMLREGSVWWVAGTAGAAVGALWNYVASSVLSWKR